MPALHAAGRPLFTCETIRITRINDPLDDRCCAIRGAVVHDYKLQVRLRLKQHRGDSRPDGRLGIECWYHD